MPVELLAQVVGKLEGEGLVVLDLPLPLEDEEQPAVARALEMAVDPDPGEVPDADRAEQQERDGQCALPRKRRVPGAVPVRGAHQLRGELQKPAQDPLLLQDGQPLAVLPRHTRLRRPCDAAVEHGKPGAHLPVQAELAGMTARGCCAQTACGTGGRLHPGALPDHRPHPALPAMGDLSMRGEGLYRGIATRTGPPASSGPVRDVTPDAVMPAQGRRQQRRR